MKTKILYIIIITVIFSCDKPTVRKPISHRKGISYFDESIKYNKELLKLEEQIFRSIIRKDTIHKYFSSPYGFWYFYTIKNNDVTARIVKPKDEVIINYEIRDVSNKVIISEVMLGSKGQVNKADRLLKIDGENFISGLHEGVKLMKVGEDVTFLLPSSLAFGASGLKDIIRANQPLIIRVKLKRIINNY